jgi:predicted PurR-regulated permease PerM
MNPGQWRLVRALLLPLTILSWLAVVVLVGWLMSHLARALLMLALAAIIAYAITPLVNLLSSRVHRPVALAISYILIFAVLFGFLSFIVVTAAGQVTVLIHNLPGYFQNAQKLEPRGLALLSPFGVGMTQLNDLRNTLIHQAQTFGAQAAGSALGTVQAVFGGLVDAILVLILSVYLTANGPRIREWIRDHGAIGRGERVESVVSIVNQVVGGYVRGTLTLASLVGLLVGVGMQVAGLPYAILLGVIAFFMEFIPVVGVIISGALCVAIALLEPPWWRALGVLAWFVVVHIIEGDFIGPRIMGRAVGIHPAVALFALIAGTELFGIWGALFGAPIAGLIQGLVVAFWQDWRRSQLTLQETEEPEIILPG